NIYNTRTTNVTRITYVNQHVNNGVTVVSHDTFVNARPVGRNIVRVNDREITEASVTHRPDIQPSRQSVMGAGGSARVKPPQAVIDRRVIATRNPAPPRQPFNQRPPRENVRTEAPNPRPQMEAHPEQPKADNNRPQLESHPEQPKADNSRPQMESHPESPRPPANDYGRQTHPLVREAPPVREKTPAH